ncbi:DUF6959 family protein [Catenulispora yoronensis]
MERVEVELFTDGSNNAVVRMPGRSFPGVLVQGDSLSVIRSDVAGIRDACRAEGAAEALELAEFLLADLDAILLRYTDALDRHDLRRPF